ncbi:MAG: YncE family protein [Gammaproteobacteria bacterium]|nr:YncE family protein [Gammaproteobacteria bacterium]MBV9619613.1 YncE family protein [Gammaproteobacteria bacterium]
MRVWGAVLCALPLALPALPAAAAPAYTVVRTVTLGGEGGWDYLSLAPKSGRLFIAHGTQVEVIDTRTLQPVGSVADTPGVHGIAPVEELGRGYISAGRADAIVEFDLASLKRLKEIKSTGKNPDAIIYDPAARRVWAFNGHSNNATVIDTDKDEVTGTVALSGKPEFAASDGQGRVYVNIEDQGKIAVLDARELRVIAEWPLPGCEEPSGLAINAAGGQLFSACSNRTLVALDTHDGHVLGTAPIGAGVDAAAYDPQARLIFASCGEGVLSVLSQDASGAPRPAQAAVTARGARTMALDALRHRVYLVTADFGPAPAASAEQPHPRPAPVAGSFKLLVLAPHPEQTTQDNPGKKP